MTPKLKWMRPASVFLEAHGKKIDTDPLSETKSKLKLYRLHIHGNHWDVERLTMERPSSLNPWWR